MKTALRVTVVTNIHTTPVYADNAQPDLGSLTTMSRRGGFCAHVCCGLVSND
jgi:hypothetical protein